MASNIQYLNLPDRTTLVIKQADDSSVLGEIKKGKYDSLWLRSGSYESIAHALVEKNFDLKYLKLHSDVRQDISWIQSIDSIVFLELQGKYYGNIDFDVLPNLKHLNAEFNKTTRPILGTRTKLEKLGIKKFDEPLSEFGLSLLSSLRLLSLTGSRATDLKNIGKFKNLEAVELDRMHKLVDADDLKKCRKLKRLGIYGCNQINSLDFLKSLKALESLVFENKSLPSVSILPRENLKTLTLGTNCVIGDGDVESLLNFPKLELAQYRRKSGYKYNAKELKEIMDQRAI